MYIIHGSKDVTTVIGKGEFDCPQCRSRRYYQHKRIERFRTVYFMPVVPSGVVAEFVECQLCGGKFAGEVLRGVQEAAKRAGIKAEQQQAVFELMILLITADGRLDDREVDAYIALHQKFFDRRVEKKFLEDAILDAQKAPRSVADCLQPIAAALDDSGRTMIVETAWTLATADGKIQEEEMRAFFEIGEALEIPASRMKEIIRAMSAKNDLMSDGSSGGEEIDKVLGKIALETGGTLHKYPQPGRLLKRVVLRDLNSERGIQREEASVEDGGAVRIAGHDVGPGVSQAFGADVTSYEWVYVVAAERVAALILKLGGSQGDDVLELIRAYYEKTGGQLDDLLKSPEIGAMFENWHS